MNNKLQNKYDNLSLVDRNAYEQIVERRKVSLFGLPYSFIRVAIDLGLFFIITSLIIGIDISFFRNPYLALLEVVGYGIVISLVVMVLFGIINIFKLNKLKRKLLNE